MYSKISAPSAKADGNGNRNAEKIFLFTFLSLSSALADGAENAECLILRFYTI